ncbi:MAG: cation diffusion facilitator family transporter [Muribaculaceae bacterium]|nr:cation transporter [Bacteroides sp.]MDE6263428.1 cation diffusion facilitator family transporter [Muribaculaceae bacterium]
MTAEHSHHHHHHHPVETINKIMVWSIIINLLYVVIEAGVGIYGDSLGLVSDAGHNLGDVFSLVLTLIGFKLAHAAANHKFTYGYQKSTILIALLNAVILLVAVGVIIVESIRKIKHPEPIDGALVSWTAGIGIIVNGLTAWMLMKDQKHDLNIRGAFLHMAADTLVSFGVVIAGIIISLTGFVMIDPIISLVIAAVILVSTWHMLRESLSLSIDGVPEEIDVDRLKSDIESLPHVKSIHHIHVWALSTTLNAMTAHVVIDSRENEDSALAAIKQLAHEAGINHPTIQFETTPCEGCSTYAL